MKSQRKSHKKQTFPWLFMTESHFFWLFLTFFFTEGDWWPLEWMADWLTGHHYPTIYCPHDYRLEGCCHPDISDDDLKEEDLPSKYKANLDHLLAASMLSEHKSLCVAVGLLCKQTIFSGLPCQPLPISSLFTMDMMHLPVLNEPDLFIKVFTGNLMSMSQFLLTGKTGTGWSSMADPGSGVHMVKLSQDLCLIFNSGYKVWEFSDIAMSMDSAQCCFGTSSLNTGGISTGLLLESASYSALTSLKMSSYVAMTSSHTLLRNLKNFIISVRNHRSPSLNLNHHLPCGALVLWSMVFPVGVPASTGCGDAQPQGECLHPPTY